MSQGSQVKFEIKLPDAALVDECRVTQEVSADKAHHAPRKRGVRELNWNVAEILTELGDAFHLQVTTHGYIATHRIHDDDRQLGSENGKLVKSTSSVRLLKTQSTQAQLSCGIEGDTVLAAPVSINMYPGSGAGIWRELSVSALASAGGTVQMALRTGPQTARLFGSAYFAIKLGGTPRFIFAKCLSLAKRFLTAFSQALRFAPLPNHHARFPGDGHWLRL